MAHNQYLTFNEYQGYGGTLSGAAFPLMEMKCRKRIDRLTDSRVQQMQSVPEAVKFCMLSLINMESTAGAEAQLEKPVVTSFSTDGYSETYGKAMSADDVTKSMDATVREFLYGEVDDCGVPLLFRGVNAE